MGSPLSAESPRQRRARPCGRFLGAARHALHRGSIPVMATTTAMMNSTIKSSQCAESPVRVGSQRVISVARATDCSGDAGSLIFNFTHGSCSSEASASGFDFPCTRLKNTGTKNNVATVANVAADNGAAQRRILFAAFANPQRHRKHADNHGQRRHQNGTKARESGIMAASTGSAPRAFLPWQSSQPECCSPSPPPCT